MCIVLGHLVPFHRCARSLLCVVRAVSWATWLLFTSVLARCGVELRVRCPGSLGSCSPLCPLGVLRHVCGALGLLAPVHRWALRLRFVACAVSWATWLLFTGVAAQCAVLRVRCPAPLGSCSPLCSLRALCSVCGVLGDLAPVRRCARSLCCVACAVSWATWLLFTGVPAQCVALSVQCPGPPRSCSPICSLGALCCVCGVLGQLAPVHRCARSVRYVAWAVSWAPWLLFTGVLDRCVVWRVRCLGPLGPCSPMCPLLAWCCVCGVLSHLAPVHRCARSVRCVACAVLLATWLLFTCVLPRCIVLHYVCGVLRHLAPVHRCARSVCCVTCAVSWATWLLFTGVLARCVSSRVPCPGPLGSYLPMCPLRAWCYVYGVLSHLAPVHLCAPSLCCVVLRVRCPVSLGSCSPVCPLGVLRHVCGVLGDLASVHRCACSVRCVACAVSGATWLLFTHVPAPCVVSRVRCPGPLGFCSPVCSFGVLRYMCGVLGHLAPVHRGARSVCCVTCVVYWATWLLLTGVLSCCVLLCVRCPGPLGSCSPVCPLGALSCVCGVLGNLAPVHRCARSVRYVACAVSWATWLLFTSVLAPCICVACAVSWATWLLFTGVLAPCVVLCVRCPGPLGSYSPVCSLGVLD